ncbi:MAG: porphobilinogen deaminase [Cirrosporium novae-zelandiae]|nr:MAG: porphobilinogen deaminase [Cirrosporium novae-zelandiae]
MSSTISPPAASPSPSQKPIVRIGSRKSKLAIVQTEIIVSLLQKSSPEYTYEIKAMSTTGDKNQQMALHNFGAKALWTQELEGLLVEGDIDCIVHSLKDIPTTLPPGCTLGAVPARASPYDALSMHPTLLPTHKSLSTLPPNSIVGTSSVRRIAQLARLYPHLRFRSVRGNVGTRLGKLDGSDLKKEASDEVNEEGYEKQEGYSCLVLAAAGLERLDLGDRITHLLAKKKKKNATGEEEEEGIYHAVGQGALGVEIRQGDERISKLVSKLDHLPTRLECEAERALMRELEGGCSVPIGVETEWVEEQEEGVKKELILRGWVGSLDGKEAVEGEAKRKVGSLEEARELGREVAKVLRDGGAGRILEAIIKEKREKEEKVE